MIVNIKVEGPCCLVKSTPPCRQDNSFLDGQGNSGLFGKFGLDTGLRPDGQHLFGLGLKCSIQVSV